MAIIFVLREMVKRKVWSVRFNRLVDIEIGYTQGVLDGVSWPSRRRVLMRQWRSFTMPSIRDTVPLGWSKVEARGRIELLSARYWRRSVGLRRPLGILDYEAVRRGCLQEDTSEKLTRLADTELTAGGGTMMAGWC